MSPTDLDRVTQLRVVALQAAAAAVDGEDLVGLANRSLEFLLRSSDAAGQPTGQRGLCSVTMQGHDELYTCALDVGHAPLDPRPGQMKHITPVGILFYNGEIDGTA